MSLCYKVAVEGSVHCYLEINWWASVNSSDPVIWPS